MEPGIIVLLALAVLLLLLVMETPVAFALATSGVMGLVLLRSFSHAASVVGAEAFNATHVFSFTIIPMYILIGMFAVYGRIAEQAYTLSNHLFRRVPGGLGAATVMACAGFAAVTGSSVATAATMARLSIGEMVRNGYPARFAAGAVASAGTLGVLIPPSIILVIYALLTGESTGALLSAGILPGLLSATAYIAYILVRGPMLLRKEAARRERVGAAQPAATVDPDRRLSSALNAAAEKASTRANLPWRGAVRIGLLFGIVLGGIYTGVMTPTESGAVGAAAALIMMLIELRKESKATIWTSVKESFKESASITSMVFTVLVGSLIFSAMLNVSRVPRSIADSIISLDVPPVVVVALILLAMVPLGMALESLSIMVVMIPLVYPVIIELGFDGVWFGIMVVKVIEVGLVTPPVGITAYVVAGSSSHVDVEDVFRGVIPFLMADFVVILLLFAFPSISLFLPNYVR